MKLARIVKVKVLKDKHLNIKFDDGKSFICDMKKYIDKGVSKPLKDDDYFAKVKVEDHTIRWPNEYDICPDTLYREMKKQLKQQHNQ